MSDRQLRQQSGGFDYAQPPLRLRSTTASLTLDKSWFCNVLKIRDLENWGCL